MKIKKLIVMVSFVTAACHVGAQVTESKPNSDVPADLVGQKIKTMYPNTTISEVRHSVIASLYEVVMGQNMAYTDGDGRYFIFGRLYDMQQQVDLTAQRQQEQQASQRVTYPSAFLNNAIKTVKGNGHRQLVVFSDPDCRYCQQLEKELAKLDNITIFTFLYPVLGEGSKTLSVAVWCSPDKSTAWRDLMLRQIQPVTASGFTSCVTPVEANTTLGTQLGIAATPTLITTDGRVLQGAASAEKLNAWLGEVK